MFRRLWEDVSGTPSITPIPVPDRDPVAGVLLYGGVFDPPHRAHVELGGLAREQVCPGGWLVLVPAARSPLKEAAPTADAHRVEMVRLASRGVPRSVVWTDEIDRAARSPGEKSYWIDTLLRARAVLPGGARLRFLIGADQVLDFHRWRGSREILELAEAVVLLRPPVESVERLREGLRAARFWSDAEIEEWAARVVDAPLRETSATAVRAKLAAGDRDVGELHPDVLEYIRRNGLYRD